ncbi:hypothetical protein CN918_26160 [Priestia megaterium]|nr:hypothetical protein CN918_26160 [Priestia megaterium]
MNNNPFKELLELDVIKQELSRKEETNKENPNYFPKPKKMEELGQVIPNLINFINKVNPFAEKIVFIDRYSLEIARELKMLFPFKDKVLNKLTEESLDKVVTKWKEGVEKTIRLHSNEIIGKESHNLSEDDLIFIFTEPIIKHTKASLLNKNYRAWDIIHDIYLNAPHVTANLNSDVRYQLRIHYFDNILTKSYTERDIETYKKLKYKPLDVTLNNALETDSHEQFVEKIQYIRNFLDFVSTPLEVVLTKSLSQMQLTIRELEIRKQELDEAIKQKEQPLYKQKNNQFCNGVQADIRIAERKYNNLFLPLHKGLEVLSSVYGEYSKTKDIAGEPVKL